MAAFEIRVWTYWEGPRTVVQDACLESISRIVGNLHVHLTPENLSEWIELPAWAQDLHVAARADLLRALLLAKYGGLWLDADILLLNDPFEAVGDRAVAWRERYMGNTYKVSIGALWIPVPRHPFPTRATELFADRPNLKSYLSGFAVWNRAYEDTRTHVDRGSYSDFYSVRATQWELFWKQNDLLSEEVLGFHLWWDAISRDGRYSNLDIRSLQEKAPESLLAQYLRSR